MSTAPKVKERPQLQDWFNENMPDPKTLLWAKSARNQIMWVRDCLSYMFWNNLICDPTLVSYEDRIAMVTVDGTHTSKSVLLPVYRFDVDGVTVKLRGNFHDWCVRCWTPLVRPFPDWMHVGERRGYFEGMSEGESPVAFCVGDRERLYAVLWWMFNEGIKR